MTTDFINPCEMKLTSRGYEFEGCQRSFAAVAENLQSRQLPMHVCFKQNVLGHVVVGHTLKDSHGRWAMEFKTGRQWSDGDSEELTPYVTPKVLEDENKNSRRLLKRKYAPIVAAKPWWKFW